MPINRDKINSSWGFLLILLWYEIGLHNAKYLKLNLAESSVQCSHEQCDKKYNTKSRLIFVYCYNTSPLSK